jgi:penicillin-binding protein 1A
MQKCYADPSLHISLEDFEKPEKLSININCDEISDKKDGDKEEIPEEDTDF